MKSDLPFLAPGVSTRRAARLTVLTSFSQGAVVSCHRSFFPSGSFSTWEAPLRNADGEGRAPGLALQQLLAGIQLPLSGLGSDPGTSVA